MFFYSSFELRTWRTILLEESWSNRKRVCFRLRRANYETVCTHPPHGACAAVALPRSRARPSARTRVARAPGAAAPGGTTWPGDQARGGVRLPTGVVQLPGRAVLSRLTLATQERRVHVYVHGGGIRGKRTCRKYQRTIGGYCDGSVLFSRTYARAQVFR